MELFDVYPLMDLEPASAEGSWIKDVHGNRYLDLYGGHAVISIGHSHPHYVQKLNSQIEKIGFYSNSVQNPLQKQLATKLGKISGFEEYNLFLCNSGTEANENALRLARYYTGKQGVIAFRNGFHGRTAGSMGVTSNPCITAPFSNPDHVYFADLNDLSQVEGYLRENDIGAVILECIQGIGGVKIATEEFYSGLVDLCANFGAILIADEVQAGFGRSGKFFSFQHYSHPLNPQLITMAKGMGNGFPVGGVLISPQIEAKYGLLGSTFGGNYMACAAVLAVIEVIQKTNLLINAHELGDYLMKEVTGLPGLKQARGRGLMIGLDFDFPVNRLRQDLVTKHRILTGSSSDPNTLRILPSLAVKKDELDIFISALHKVLIEEKYNETVYFS